MKISIIGNESSHEFSAGKILKEAIESQIPASTVGELCICTNVQIFGQKVRDIDIVVFGYFKDLSEQIYSNTNKNPTKFKTRKVCINSICITIELKEQDSKNVEMIGTNLKVNYSDGTARDVTAQSEEQRYSLKNFINQNASHVFCYINNLIWLFNLSELSIKNLTNNVANNLLPSKFNFNFLISKLCEQTPPMEISSEVCSFSSFSPKKNSNVQIDYHILYDFLASPKLAVNELTRKNVERITSDQISIQPELKEALGSKLIRISGRAGTGKTIKMLKIACELASNQQKRCLFLTYNRALVEDISRLLALSSIPDDFDFGCVKVKTIHEFVREISLALGIIEHEQYSFDKHETLCQLLIEYLKSNVITQDDIADLMKNRFEMAYWDHVFIDESQDFEIFEKSLLFSFFGYQKLIIADGVDQFIRGIGRMQWDKNIYVYKCEEKKSLRQKRNLSSFVKDYGQYLGLNWNVDICNSLLGGTVNISRELFPYDLLKRNRELTYSSGNTGFDILYLTPPKYVVKGGNSTHFQHMKNFEENGIQLWDGTNKKNITYGYGDLSKHRLLQYDSCRGLEGWSVICLGFDKLIEYKLNTFNYTLSQEFLEKNNLMMDITEAKIHFVNLWTLIPLTRAIDTLILTFEDPNSISKIFPEELLKSDYINII